MPKVQKIYDLSLDKTFLFDLLKIAENQWALKKEKFSQRESLKTRRYWC